ncbi:Nucleolar protein 12 [Fulvia fulva]|nr:Nucleolar protein 12 [Fulvia fulva]WPV09386.1 Nucleolar protein 12 [Fulvia fulva]WPV23357.1 Nucleolar protein 12 [Fulvia fulva]
MSEKSKKKDKSKVEKTSKKSSKDGSMPKEQKQKAAASAFALLADDKTVNPTLSSLFAVKQPPVKAKPAAPKEPRVISTESSDEEGEAEDEDNDAELSELDEDLDDEEVPDDDSEPNVDVNSIKQHIADESEDEGAKSKRKRKRKAADEELEDVYMGKLAREEEKEARRLAAERATKRQKSEAQTESPDDSDEAEEEAVAGADANGSDVEVEEDEDAMSPPPKHETQQQADDDLSKANRTVFLSNVSTDAISSKSSRKTLLKHLGSFFDKRTSPKAGDAKHKVESIRFRSTPYASAIPKKAAFAKKELMDATTKSTNAYAVYSSPILAREAAKRLNGTIVLDRHLRVDEVAHPAKVDNRRCVFVGNLGFVDDESNIQDANEEDGREKRKRGKEPADIEEGLWRTFGKCGRVESVRVIRDSTTRVGKGIAYVQFEDENAVEAALLYNDKKFPPMLPRKLRVSRAKAQKRNPKPGSDRPAARKANTGGYQRKITGEEASTMGRASKLLGRAGAAQMRSTDAPRPGPKEQKTGAPAAADAIKKPEAFIFEGHRATSKQGKSGLKLGGKHNKASGGKKTKVTSRSSAFKAKKKAA